MSDRKIVDSLDYRKVHVDFYDDDYGQQVYTIWEGKEFGFGAYNLNYKEDMKYLIDEKFDLITRFPELQQERIYGAKLSFFFNGYGYRDIGLYARGRLIKVFLLENQAENYFPTEDEQKNLIEESTEILRKYYKQFC